MGSMNLLSGGLISLLIAVVAIFMGMSILIFAIIMFVRSGRAYYKNKSEDAVVPEQDFNGLHLEREASADGEDEGKSAEEAIPVFSENDPADALFSLYRSNQTYGADYRTDLSFSYLCDSFASFASARGLEMETAQIRMVFTAMQTSRLVVVDPTNLSDAKFSRFMAVLGEFFGDATEVQHLPAKTPNDEYWNWNKALLLADNGSASALLKKTYQARIRENEVTVAALDRVPASEMEAVFAKYLKFFETPAAPYPVYMFLTSARTALPLFQGVDLVLPQNLWYFVMRDSADTAAIPATVARVAAILPLEIKRAEERTPAETEARALPAFKSFEMCCDRVLDEYFLSLELWKKIDLLEAFLKKEVGFSIGNKLARRMETFSSVYLACGATPAETLDFMLASLMLPALNKEQRAVLYEDAHSFANEMETVLGASNIASCMSVWNGYKRADEKLGFDLAGASVGEEN